MSDYQEAIQTIREQVRGSYEILMKRTGYSKPTVVRAFNVKSTQELTKAQSEIIDAACKLIEERKKANDRKEMSVIETAKKIK